jgi:hypothetical protein
VKYPDANPNPDGTPASNTTGLDDDRPLLLVNSISINEASPFAVFEVRLSNPSVSSILFTPSLTSGTASIGADTATRLEYYDGTRWVSASGGVPIPAGQVGPVKVRVALVNDAFLEGEERFILSVAATGVASGRGQATIFDDGRGVVHDADGNPTSLTPNDDTPVVQPAPASPIAPVPVPQAVRVVLPADSPAVPIPLSTVPIAPLPIREIPTLSTANVIPDQFGEPGKEARFGVPEGTFISTNPGERLTLSAQLTDGRPLPDWLQFNSTTGVFIGTPPGPFKGTVEIRVTARDSQGKEADSVFKLEVGDVEEQRRDQERRSGIPVPAGRTSFNQQLREMGRGIALKRATGELAAGIDRMVLPDRQAAQQRVAAGGRLVTQPALVAVEPIERAQQRMMEKPRVANARG